MMKALSVLFTGFLACCFCCNGSAAEASRLTLKLAEEMSARRHPRIAAAELRALAARQASREVKSAYFPTVTANVTAVGTAAENTRIAAGALNNPSIFERNAEGVAVSQLITDFGRTANLLASSRLKARAEETNAVVTREQILLQVHSAYFSALQAQSVLGVARQTIETRKLLLDQVEELARNKLKSDLDVSFASVNLQESQLLQAKAQNDLRSAMEDLAMLVGETNQTNFLLVEEAMPPQLTVDTAELVRIALQQKPELIRLRLERDAATQFARAEKKLKYPVISAVGSAGVVPIHDPALPDSYAAAGVNLSIPLAAGGLYSAREKEADLKARALEESVRDEENNLIREVRIARMNVDYTFERMALTAKLSAQAAQALELAQARYNLGASSIVEVSQAQLNKTSADIARASAGYEYQRERALLDFQTGGLR